MTSISRDKFYMYISFKIVKSASSLSRNISASILGKLRSIRSKKKVGLFLSQDLSVPASKSSLVCLNQQYQSSAVVKHLRHSRTTAKASFLQIPLVQGGRQSVHFVSCKKIKTHYVR